MKTGFFQYQLHASYNNVEPASLNHGKKTKPEDKWSCNLTRSPDIWAWYQQTKQFTGQGHRGVIIYGSFVDLESPIVHAKLQDHRTSGSEEEDFFKGFGHIWVWQPSWSCDQDHLCHPFQRRHHIQFALIGQEFQRKSLKIMVIYRYIAPVQGQTATCGQFQKQQQNT